MKGRLKRPICQARKDPQSFLRKSWTRSSRIYPQMERDDRPSLAATRWKGPSERRLFSSISIHEENRQRWMDGRRRPLWIKRLLGYARSLLLSIGNYVSNEGPPAGLHGVRLCATSATLRWSMLGSNTSMKKGSTTASRHSAKLSHSSSSSPPPHRSARS